MEATPSRVDQEVCPALADLYHAHYRSLCRLAALLTGDTRTAETVRTVLSRQRDPRVR
jgi:hypothetical protein